MSRLKSNCKMMLLEPSDEREVIWVMPAMAPKARSKGVATVAAIVSGLAPGNAALTEMVGKSTCGRGAIGSNRKHRAPASAKPIVISVVATGRAMKGAEMFITGLRGRLRARPLRSWHLQPLVRRALRPAARAIA